jgi:hypothetical protein
MKRKSTVACLSVILVICIGCVVGTWLRNRTKSTIELLWPLSSTQRQCVENIVAKNKLVYVEKQADEQSIAIGYLIDEDYYVALFSTVQDSSCQVEFHRKVWDCYDEYQAVYCQERDYGFKPQKIERVELTGSPPEEVYVWFDISGMGNHRGAKHKFHVKQSDDSFEAILTLRLCVPWSSLEIDNESRDIVATTSVVCDMGFGRAEHIRYSLLDGTPRKFEDWFDE